MSVSDITAVGGASGLHLAWRGLTYDVPAPKADGKRTGSGADEKGGAKGGGGRPMKRILHALTGEASPGALTAVMGPSGSGKSTLIAALGGRLTSGLGGEIVVNGTARSGGGVPPEMVHLVGYVAQEDYLFGCLTVRETLRFCATLRMSDRPADEREARVNAAIEEFDLSQCANTHIGKPLEPGGISGGERRRLSIACEMMHSPALVMLDEPTSGLDAATALSVIRLLRARANSPRSPAVMLSIHQPRATIPPLLDAVLLLAAGHDMYFGPAWKLANGMPSTDGVLGYLEAAGHPAPAYENPADFLLDLVNTRVDSSDNSAADEVDLDEDRSETAKRTDTTLTVDLDEAARERRSRVKIVRELALRWTRSKERAVLSERTASAGKHLSMPQRRQGGDTASASAKLLFFARKFYALWLRCTLFKLREPQVTATQFGNAVIVPLVFGAVYWQMNTDVDALGDHVSAISLTVLMQSFMCFDQLTLFPKERALFLHESKGGLYGTAIFYLTRTLGETPMQLIFGWVCAAITYEMYGLRDSAEARMTYYLAVVLATLAGAAVLTAIGSLCKDMDQSMGASSVLLLFMIFDGNWVNLNNVPPYLRWLQRLSFMGWGVEVAVVNEFKAINFTCPEISVPAEAEEGEAVAAADADAHADALTAAADDATLAQDFCTPITGQQAIYSLGFQDVVIGKSLRHLIVFQLAFRLAGFLGLHFLYTGETLRKRWERLIGKL